MALREIVDAGVVIEKPSALIDVESMLNAPDALRAMPQRSRAENRRNGTVISAPWLRNESISMLICDASIYDGSKLAEATVPSMA